VVRRSLRPIGVLSIVVCAAAGIAGAGTLLLSRNSVSSLPWYAQPQQSAETEEAIESSASKAALMPATVKPPTITSESSNQQPSPEERVELVKRGHALLKAEATAAQSNIETPPVAVPPTSATQEVAPSATQEVAPSATATVPAPNNETAENLAATQSAIQAQQRLIELGYMSGGADGKWGPQSKRALLEYKRQAGLKPQDALDAATEQSLFAANAPRAVSQLLFVGGWSLEPGRCGDPHQPPPIRITATRAETSGGFCLFNSIQPDGNAAWRIEASCSGRGATHLAHIRLAVNGSVLQWTSEQPEVRYYRCSTSR
jgi:hypothetical protein